MVEPSQPPASCTGGQQVSDPQGEAEQIFSPNINIGSCVVFKKKNKIEKNRRPLLISHWGNVHHYSSKEIVQKKMENYSDSKRNKAIKNNKN